MSDNYSSVRAASARLGGLSSYGRTPDPKEEAEARRSLATARVDRELRGTLRQGVRFDGVQAAHLTGLLLSVCGVKYDAATLIEKIVRQAVDEAQADWSDR
ncbi:MAG: hypothetical protein KDB63_14065 [Nocardioidaceae bacterium]|nr:hypothetical protein [Nocardioidaceae bacterium]